MQIGKATDPMTNHRIDMLMLAITVTLYPFSLLAFLAVSYAQITISSSFSSAILYGKIAKIPSHSKLYILYKSDRWSHHHTLHC